MGLRVLLRPLLTELRNRPAQRDHTPLQIHVRPPQRAQLTAPRTGRHRQPDESTPVRVLPRRLDELRGLLGGRRLRIGRPRGRCRHKQDRVDSHPAPPHALLVRHPQDEVDVPDRRRRQRVAAMRPAAHVALMLAGRAMVGASTVGAVDTAAAELRVERVEYLGVDRACLQPADERPDVLHQVLGVHRVGGAADVERLQIAVEQLVESRVRARAPALVDLAEHPDSGIVGALRGLRAGRDDRVMTRAAARGSQQGDTAATQQVCPWWGGRSAPKIRCGCPPTPVDCDRGRS